MKQLAAPCAVNPLPRDRAALRGMHGLSVRLVCRVQLADGPAAGQGFKLTRTRKWDTKMSASKHG